MKINPKLIIRALNECELLFNIYIYYNTKIIIITGVIYKGTITILY